MKCGPAFDKHKKGLSMPALPQAIREAHLVYYVSDIDRSTRFYGDVLGLEMAWAFGQGVVGFKLAGGCVLVLCEDANRVRPAATPPLVLKVDDIDTAVEDLKARGVPFDDSADRQPQGCVATFRDPDSYAFDLCG
jgi:catechol 2,3-dioxygenase-like lactoylglutathione lyase family enzyme